MKKWGILIITVQFLLTPLWAQFSNKTMMVGSENRSYRQYLPAGFNAGTETGLPLIIALHGLGDNMTNFSQVGFQYIADTARFLVVYPQGTPNFVSQNAWNNGTLLSSGSNDIAFLGMLIDTMIVKYQIDVSRVYFTGFSMGGIMSYHMLCALPHRIAAIASVSGTMSDADISSCNPGRAVPVMHMHGTQDGTVPYDSAALPSLSLVPATLAFWQNNNGCADSSVYNLPDITSDGITVDTIRYNSCGAPVVHWRENGADHQWLYRPVNDVDATTEIWLFFRNKVHPSASPLGTDTELVEAPSVFMSHDQLSIISSAALNFVGVYDLQGKKIYESELSGITQWQLPLYGTKGAVIVKIMAGEQTIIRKIVSVY